MAPRRRKPPRAGALSDLPPLKIIRSILLLQVIYYTIASILIVFTAVVLGEPLSVALVLDWNSVRGDNTLGWIIGVLWLLTSLFIVIPLLLIISRSKLIPDFALTIHFFHLVVTILFTRSLPSNLLWWLLQAGSAALMIFLGIWACRYRELKPISFGTGVMPAMRRKDTAPLPNGNVLPGDDYVGDSGGRKKNIDDGPSYEMVGLKKGDENV